QQGPTQVVAEIVPGDKTAYRKHVARRDGSAVVSAAHLKGKAQVDQAIPCFPATTLIEAGDAQVFPGQAVGCVRHDTQQKWTLPGAVGGPTEESGLPCHLRMLFPDPGKAGVYSSIPEP